MKDDRYELFDNKNEHIYDSVDMSATHQVGLIIGAIVGIAIGVFGCLLVGLHYNGWQLP